MSRTRQTLLVPHCTCCPQPSTLIPRDDLPGALAACPTSGQLYRPDAGRYVATTLPPLVAERPSAPSVQIDLSQSGYA